ncbi:hypothetical protein [Methanothrix sp.]|uniref:hypothetical protein n=1 Tax=Methanothrix sp. TaxID=90426 RepID=UPI003BB6BC03
MKDLMQIFSKGNTRGSSPGATSDIEIRRKDSESRPRLGRSTFMDSEDHRFDGLDPDGGNE